MKEAFLNILLFIVSTLVMLLLCEAVFRLYYSFRSNLSTQPDVEMGWIVRPDTHLKSSRTDYSGKPYDCVYTTDDKGFRKYGNPASDRYKVLFIGDSFTQAEEVSSDSTYYAVAGRHAPIEVFGIGVGAFGTLQESMLLKRIIADVRPNLVVLQFTSNDFINNCYELENRSIQNCGTTRPYLNMQDKIEYRFPKDHARLREFANNHSRMLFFLINRLDAWQRKPDQFTLPDYRGAVIKTGYAIERIKRICASQHSDLVSFMVERGNGIEHRLYQRLMQTHRVPVLADVPALIETAEKSGLCCRAADGGHWNNAGHRICGQALAAKIQEKLKNESAVTASQIALFWP